MNIAQRIYEHVSGLSEPAALEVLDFVEFVEARSSQRAGKGAGLSREEAEETAGAGQWPSIVMTFEGIADLPPFELDRGLLTPPANDPLS